MRVKRLENQGDNAFTPYSVVVTVDSQAELADVRSAIYTLAECYTENSGLTALRHVLALNPNK